MTEKRFTLAYEKGNWWAVKDGDITLWKEEVVGLLNALHEENVKLQARNKYLATKIQRERNSHIKQHEKWENEIQKENERLKQREERLLCEIEDFQELLTKNDNVCHKRVINLIDDKISFLSEAKAEVIKDDYRYGQIAFAIQWLRGLKKELQE